MLLGIYSYRLARRILEVMSHRDAVDFFTALQSYDHGELMEVGPSGYDS